MRLWLLLIAIVAGTASTCGQEVNEDFISDRAKEAVNSTYGWDYTNDVEHFGPDGEVSDYIILNDTFEIEEDEMFYPRRRNPQYRDYFRVGVSRRDGLYEVYINRAGIPIKIEKLKRNEYKKY